MMGNRQMLPKPIAEPEAAKIKASLDPQLPLISGVSFATFISFKMFLLSSHSSFLSTIFTINKAGCKSNDLSGKKLMNLSGLVENLVGLKL